MPTDSPTVDSSKAQRQTPQRNWLQTAIVWFMWGTDGLKRGDTVSFQISLNTLLLIITLGCVLLTQFMIQRAGDAQLAAWREGLMNGVVVPIDPHWRRVERLLGLFNLVAVIAAISFYRRKGRLGLWIGVAIAATGIVLATLIDSGLRGFYD